MNEIVFSAAMWGTYQPLMRADFRLFDEYEFSHAGGLAWRVRCAHAMSGRTSLLCNWAGCGVRRDSATKPSIQRLRFASGAYLCCCCDAGAGEAAFDFPLATFFGARDRRVAEWMVQVRRGEEER